MLFSECTRFRIVSRFHIYSAGTGAVPYTYRYLSYPHLPTSLHVAAPPLFALRWERPHGWLVGKITDKFTSATPRVFAKFNYRIKWFDGWENQQLDLDNYNSGPAAPYNSWALLEKEE